MATKKATQFALPHNTTYKLVDSYYAGSILDGGGCACENCGKLITNVGVVANAAGARFNVGMDCAATLSGLNPLELDQHQYRFQQAKSLVAKIRNAKKKHGENLTVTAQFTYDNERVSVEGMVSGNRGGRAFLEYYEKELFERVIFPGGQGVVPVAAPAPAPDWFGTVKAPFERGATVRVLVDGQPKEARVLATTRNRTFPNSQYCESLMLTGLSGKVFDPSEILS